MIAFDEKKHKYHDENGKEYISVTTLLGQLFPFDRNAIANQIRNNPNSSYYQWTLKEIFADWAHAAREGNRLHHACEMYSIKNFISEDPSLKPCVEQFSKLRFKGKVIPEQRVYSTKWYIAGTADILEDLGEYIYLWDIKTCKRLDSGRKHKFSLQLEIYKRLVEEVYNKPCRVGGIIFFENFVGLQEKTKLTVHKPEDVKKEVDDILARRLQEI